MAPNSSDPPFGPDDLAAFLADAAQNPNAAVNVVGSGVGDIGGSPPGLDEPNSVSIERVLTDPISSPEVLLPGNVTVTLQDFAYADEPDHGEYLAEATMVIDDRVRAGWLQTPHELADSMHAMQAMMLPKSGGPPSDAAGGAVVFSFTVWPLPNSPMIDADTDTQYELLNGYKELVADALAEKDIIRDPGDGLLGDGATGESNTSMPGGTNAHPATPFDLEPSVDPTKFRVDVTGLGWEDIALPVDTLQAVRELILGPVRTPTAYQTAGLTPPTGVLLSGEPGVGKTLLAKVIASETDAAFYQVTPSQFKNQLFGASETIVSKLFAMAEETDRPAILFLDELDSVLQQRGATQEYSVTRDIVNQFLQEMDGLEPLESTLVLGATNRIEDVDDAARRPGRFDEELALPLPDQAARTEIFQIEQRHRRAAGARYADDIDCAALAARTDGCTGADIVEVVRSAGKHAVRERGPDVETVTRTDFEQALAEHDASDQTPHGFQ